MTFLELNPRAQAVAAFEYLRGYNEGKDLCIGEFGAIDIGEAYDLCADPTIQEDYDYTHEGNTLAVQGELF